MKIVKRKKEWKLNLLYYFFNLIYLQTKKGLSLEYVDGKGKNESGEIENDEIRARNLKENKIVLIFVHIIISYIFLIFLEK